MPPRSSTPDHIPEAPAFYRTPLFIGGVRLESRFTLAPLAGYTNYPFRRSIHGIGGVGLCTTDLVNARAILEGSAKTMDLLATGPDDRPLSVQIFGSRPGEMGQAAKFLQSYGATSVDINMGCPVRKVVSVGGGAAMMCDTTGATVRTVQDVVESVTIPVTVKMRLGWDATKLTAPFFAREFEKIGVKAVTIHGRTREQAFTGGVDRSGIRAVVDAVESIPVLGNGDVMNVADAAGMIAETGCHGIAIGRGALANPWIFRQLKAWIDTGDPGPRPTYLERIDFMRLHLVRLIEWKNEDRFGCVNFRKVAAWYAKALRLPKADKNKLQLLESLADFDAMADRWHADGQPRGWSDFDAHDAQISVPTGPIAHW